MASSSQESDGGEEPMETTEIPEVKADVFRSRLERHREFLEERIDPEYGLLIQLIANKGITRRVSQEISNEKGAINKSAKILDYILHATGTEKIVKFIEALRKTKQEHIVNYVHGDGEYNQHFGGNWPLDEAQINILDDNFPSLTELIDTAHGLLAYMIAEKVITQRQAESISAHAEPCKSSEALLEILRRGSRSEYAKTIEALNETNQTHVADVMLFGGVVLQVHSSADANLPTISQAEEIIVCQIDSVLQGNPTEEVVNALEYLLLKRKGLIGAKVKKSIVFFFHCKDLAQLLHLLELLDTKELQRIIEMIYNRVISMSSNVGVKVKWDEAEFDKAKSKLQDLTFLTNVNKEPEFDEFCRQSLKQKACQHPVLVTGSVAELPIEYVIINITDIDLMQIGTQNVAVSSTDEIPIQFRGNVCIIETAGIHSGFARLHCAVPSPYPEYEKPLDGKGFFHCSFFKVIDYISMKDDAS